MDGTNFDQDYSQMTPEQVDGLGELNMNAAYSRLLNVDAAEKFEKTKIYGLTFVYHKDTVSKLLELEDHLRVLGCGYFVKEFDEDHHMLASVMPEDKYEKTLKAGYMPVDVDQMTWPDFLQTVRNM